MKSHRIETPRLLLREWKPEDLRPFIKMNEDPLVMEYFPATLSESESVAFYQRILSEFEKYNFGLYAVETKQDGLFIGYTGFHHTAFESNFTPCVEIGWRLDSKAWGKGYATEAASACLDMAKNQLDISEIYSFTFVQNHRSERVMQKIGMQRICEFNHPLLAFEHPLSLHVLYKIANNFTPSPPLNVLK